MKPPFAYFGGKQTLAQRIVSLLPDHRHYVEPFAGSLAVLLAKPPSKLETVNDIDGDLMLFWRVLRDRGDELVKLAALTPHSRAEHQAAYEDTGDREKCCPVHGQTTIAKMNVNEPIPWGTERWVEVPA